MNSQDVDNLLSESLSDFEEGHLADSLMLAVKSEPDVADLAGRILMVNGLLKLAYQGDSEEAFLEQFSVKQRISSSGELFETRVMDAIKMEINSQEAVGGPDIIDVAVNRTRQTKSRGSNRRGAAGSSRRRFNKLIPLAASIMFFLGIGIFLLKNVPESITGLPAVGYIREVRGASELLRNGSLDSVDSSAPVFAGDTLETSEDQIVRLICDNERSEILVKGSSKITIRKSGEQFRPYLDHGEITVMVKEISKVAPQQFETSFGSITVRGTEFILSADNKQTRLELIEGRVDIVSSFTQKELTLDAGWIAGMDRNGVTKYEKKNSAGVSNSEVGIIKSVSLINAFTGECIRGYESISNNASVRLLLSNLPEGINMKANYSGPRDGVIVFRCSQLNVHRVDAGVPMFLYNCRNGRILPNQHSFQEWWIPEPGQYDINATPYRQKSGIGKPYNMPGDVLNVRINIVD